MQRCADAIFSPRRTTSDQFSLLWILRRHDGISQNGLASELFTDPNTVTAMLARLEKRGLLYREVCNDDGRVRRVRLTASGQRLVDRLSNDWEPMRRRLREIFSGEAGQEALRLLGEAREEMMRYREEILAKQSMRRKRTSPRKKAAWGVAGNRESEAATV
jgi:DNA-binding MarR family transcriptional regulator